MNVFLIELVKLTRLNNLILKDTDTFKYQILMHHIIRNPFYNLSSN